MSRSGPSGSKPNLYFQLQIVESRQNSQLYNCLGPLAIGLESFSIKGYVKVVTQQHISVKPPTNIFKGTTSLNIFSSDLHRKASGGSRIQILDAANHKLRQGQLKKAVQHLDELPCFSAAVFAMEQVSSQSVLKTLQRRVLIKDA